MEGYIEERYFRVVDHSVQMMEDNNYLKWAMVEEEKLEFLEQAASGTRIVGEADIAALEELVVAPSGLHVHENGRDHDYDDGHDDHGDGLHGYAHDILVLEQED